ncbi:aprataxin-like protein [Marasmius crinis-equi]|uniref:Aprataxin-like protein n=1 Tax=Marasmius crinis-equi TaxID=585013 RepID=A0ABR3FWT6_9AGAR
MVRVESESEHEPASYGATTKLLVAGKHIFYWSETPLASLPDDTQDVVAQGPGALSEEMYEKTPVSEEQRDGKFNRELEEGEVDEEWMDAVAPLPSLSPPEIGPYYTSLGEEEGSLQSEDKPPSVQLELTETLADVAYARYGFTDDLFELTTDTVSWSDVRELLGHGRWLSPANARFREEDLRKETKERLQSFFYQLRSVDVNSIGVNLPALDLSIEDSDVCQAMAIWRQHMVLRKVKDKVYVQIGETNSPFHLLIPDPISALQIVRSEWGPNVTDIAIELYRHGIPFQTVVRGPLPSREDEPHPTDTRPTLGYRPRSYTPDLNDFDAYESARNNFLGSAKGRAAVLAGGLVGRIAREVIPEENVIYGPDPASVAETGTCIFTANGSGYWDHVLNEEEIQLICGVYFVPRGTESESDLSLKDLHSLKSLLTCDKTRAKEIITALKDDSEQVKKDIEGEMVRRYGFKWPVWTGFHASPSMHHLHLHIISADLCSEKLKHKKHYNSFHPKLGFFLHLDDVLSWFDSEPSYFTQVSSIHISFLPCVISIFQMATLDAKKYEALLKEDLSCFHCGKTMKNIPTLKEHLQQEWDAQAAQQKAKEERKRKLEEKKDGNKDGSNKRQKSS